MAKITIDLEQARDRPSRREGRLLDFPDGMQRIITLPRRNWEMYDQLAARWVYPGLYDAECFDMARQYGAPGEAGFEDALGYLFTLAIESGWSLLNEEQRESSNENGVMAWKD
jgi:hypothetical protein